MINYIHFLGSGGSRYVVFDLLRKAGGVQFRFENIVFHVDPGPCALYMAINFGIRPKDLDLIFLSHIHLDHSAEINSILESMTTGGRKKKGILFAPKEALEGESRVVLPYTQSHMEKIFTLKEGFEYEYKKGLNTLKVVTPIRHDHGVETYGFLFFYKNLKIGWITDTRYFEDLKYAYKEAKDILILNVIAKKKYYDVDHLFGKDALELISYIKPKLAIITHLGRSLIKEGPEKFARELSEKTKVKVISAYDNLKIPL